MKLKINKACDLGSISVLPPRRTTGGSAGVAASGSAAAAVAMGSQQPRSQQSISAFSQGAGGSAAAMGSQQPCSQPMSQQSLSAFSQGAGGSSAAMGSQQPRSQPLSQQSFSAFSQGAGGLHSQTQSQISQGSLDENILSLHLASPPRDQRFGLHDDSSKKMHSVPVSSVSCVREESQLQLAKTSSNPVHRWNPSLPDSRCQVPTEDIERKLQHLASSVHKMGMVLDSVQSDVMQLNRAMKEASLDSGSIQQKIVVLDNKTLKGQDDLKALVESSTKSIADQLSILNSHSNKLDEISSTLSVWPKQIESDLRQLQSEIFRIFTKEMEGVVRDIRSLNSRLAAIQMQTDQGGTTKEKPPMNQSPVPNERPQVNQKPAATCVSQTPVATVVNQTPVKNGRQLVSQTPAANGKTLMSQASVENGISLMSQVPAAKPLKRQIPAPNGRSVMSPANGRTQVNQVPVASGRTHTNKIPAPEVHPAPWACLAKAVDPKLKVEAGKVNVLPQKLTGSRIRVAPKQEEVPVNTRAPRTRVAAKKAPPVMIVIDSDDENEGHVSCVILKPPGSGDNKECHLMKEAAEESLQILRRARKRRRREMQAIVPSG